MYLLLPVWCEVKPRLQISLSLPGCQSSAGLSPPSTCAVKTLAGDLSPLHGYVAHQCHFGPWLSSTVCQDLRFLPFTALPSSFSPPFPSFPSFLPLCFTEVHLMSSWEASTLCHFHWTRCSSYFVPSLLVLCAFVSVGYYSSRPETSCFHSKDTYTWLMVLGAAKSQGHATGSDEGPMLGGRVCVCECV